MTGLSGRAHLKGRAALAHVLMPWGVDTSEAHGSPGALAGARSLQTS